MGFIIGRLEELQKEVGQINGDIAQLSARKAELQEDSARAESVRDASLISRLRSGEPLRQTEVDRKSKDLQSQMDIVDATLEALSKHRQVLEPELAELEEVARLASGWHEVAVNFVASKVLWGRIRGAIDKAVKAAPARVLGQDIFGDDIIEKSIPRCTGGSLPFYVGQCETEVLKAARKIDPTRYPRHTEVDLTMTDQGFGFDARGSRWRDRRILDDIWAEYLSVEQRLLEEHGIDIGPIAEEVSQKIQDVTRT